MPTPEITKMVRLAYFHWMFASLTLGFNIVATAAVMATVNDGQAIGDFILSIVYFLILLPSWFMIYRILYRAGRKRKPSLFIGFFILYGLEFIAFAAFAVGVPGTGAAGFLRMIKTFKVNKVAGIIVLVSAILWCANVMWATFIFLLARIHYNQAGGYQKARKEIGTSAVKEAAKHPELVKDVAITATKY